MEPNQREIFFIELLRKRQNRQAGLLCSKNTRSSCKWWQNGAHVHQPINDITVSITISVGETGFVFIKCQYFFLDKHCGLYLSLIEEAYLCVNHINQGF